MSDFAFAGDMVAYEYDLNGYMAVDEYVVVVNLRTGRTLHDAGTGPSYTSAGAGIGPTTAMVVSARGSVAWIAEDERAKYSPPRYEVRGIPRRGHPQRLFDSGTLIGPRSLRLHGCELSWTNATVTRNAGLCRPE